MAGVTFQAVAKRYGSTPVIERLDLEIRDQEFMVLVGPSGCGKSTALRMVAGLEDTSGGTILIGDRVVNDVPPTDRDVAMVFQNYALYPHMTIRQNLEFGLMLRKVPRPQIDRLVAEAAEVLGITPLLDRRPKQLSGGQRQRVAVGRAIVRHPSVFLFDEPLSNLDAKLRVQMRSEIKRLQQRLGTTAIYVTHDQVEAMTMGHRIAVLRGGALQQVGAPLEVYNRPANAFVAQFIGSPPMNVLRARVEDGGARLAAEALSLAVPAELRAALRGASGREVLVGIRPEHVAGPGAPAGAGRAPVAAVAEIVETLGDLQVVHARVGEATLVFKQDPSHAVSIGEPVTLGLDLSRLHVFDGQTERRLA
jgi:multiple sugar transport system ATP-binding protein